MTIFRQLSNPLPMTFTEIVTALTTSSASVPEPEFDLQACLCDFECPFSEKAIAYLADTTDTYKNDTKDLFWQLSDSLGTIEYRIVDNSGNETVLQDVVHGTSFPKGFNPNNGLQVAFRVDWHKIATTLGFGDYKFKAVVTNFTEVKEYNTHTYNFRPYSEMFTRNTVRIESVHNNYVINGFDYTGLSWKRSLRIKGEFFNNKEVFKNETFLNTSREVDKIETSLVSEYTLSTQLMPSYIATPLNKDKMFASRVLISAYDYTKFTTFDGSDGWIEKKVLNGFEVIPVSYEDPKYNEGTQGIFTIKFNERKQDSISRP